MIAASVGFLQSAYSRAEGDTLQISVGVLDDTMLGGEIILLVSIVPDSAQGNIPVFSCNHHNFFIIANDYSSSDVLVTLNSTILTANITIELATDGISEATESFNVTLSDSGQSTVNFAITQHTTNVQIEDNDSMLP